MGLPEDLSNLRSVFFDTAPIIYFIEAHQQYGPLVECISVEIQLKKLKAFSSVITLAEVLPKPVESGDDALANQFVDFLKTEKNISMLEISIEIAEQAGRLRGQYAYLRTMDAVQVAACLYARADAFITNDVKLKSISEINTILLRDYL